MDMNNSDFATAKARLENLLHRPVARLPKTNPIAPGQPVHFKPSPILPRNPIVRAPHDPVIHRKPIHPVKHPKAFPEDPLPDQPDSTPGSSSGGGHSGSSSGSTGSASGSVAPDAKSATGSTSPSSNFQGQGSDSSSTSGSAGSSTTDGSTLGSSSGSGTDSAAGHFSSSSQSMSSDGGISDAVSNSISSSETPASDISNAIDNSLASSNSDPARQRLTDLLSASPSESAGASAAFSTANADATDGVPEVRNNVLDAMMGSTTPGYTPRVAVPNVNAVTAADTGTSTGSSGSTSTTSGSSSSTVGTATTNTWSSYDNGGQTKVILPDGTTAYVVGDPTSFEAPLTATAPPQSVFDKSMSYASTISGAIMMTYMVATMVSNAITSAAVGMMQTIGTFAMHLVTFMNPLMGVLSIAAIALSAYSMFKTFQSMFENGFSLASLGSLAMAYLGMVIGFAHFMPAPIAALVALGVMLVMLLAAFLDSIFGVDPNKTPTALDQPLASYPSVWTQGPVLFVTAGAALMGMGINLSPTAPTYQVLTVPDVALVSTLNQSGLTTPGGDATTVSGGSSLYGTTFVQQGSGTTPDKVMIVSPAASGSDSVSVYTLNNNLHFAMPSTPTAAYIPFITGSNTLNQAAIQAVHQSSQLSQAAVALTNPVAQERGAAVNKAPKTTAGPTQ